MDGQAALPRRPLSPAFRMALLAGTITSVELHLSAGADVDAADEAGRSPLMLAASRGRLEICKLLLERGSDQSLTDHENRDALVIARSRGHADIAELLSQARTNVLGTRAIARGDVFSGSPDRLEATTVLAGIDETPKLVEIASTLIGFADQGADAFVQQKTFAPRQSLFVLEDELDISGWQAEPEAPPPLADQSCVESATLQQVQLSRHAPVDTDTSWDDVEIVLPELEDVTRRQFQLTAQKRQKLRAIILEALRDGRLQGARISDLLSQEKEEDDFATAEFLNNLRVALSDSGVVIDEDPSAPDGLLQPTEYDEELFGDSASDVLALVDRLQAQNIDPLFLYYKRLPASLLTREDEIEWGIAVEEGMKEALHGIVSSPAAVTKLLDDLEALIRGGAHARNMFDIGSIEKTLTEPDGLDDVDDEDSSSDKEAATSSQSLLSEELSIRITEISARCWLFALGARSADHISQIANYLFSVNFSSKYLSELQVITEFDVAASGAAARMKLGLSKAQNAKDRLVLANLKLVIWVAKRYRGLTLPDRIQEGNIGLMRAAGRFNPRHGAKFSSYAVWWIRQSITRAIADTGRTIRVPVHVYESLHKVNKAQQKAWAEAGREPNAERIASISELPIERVKKILRIPDEPTSISDEEGPDFDCIADEKMFTPEQLVCAYDLPVVVRELLECLDARQERVIRQRFGLGCDEQTLEEIGQVYGVTRERIRQIEAKALRTLSHPGRVKYLQKLLR